jgi:methionine--tRNA ligase beta chain
MINIDQFAQVEIRVGLVESAENAEGSNKLIRLTVDLGDEKRTIFTGVRTYGYTPEDFAGKKFLFVTNLEYKKIMGTESEGMILAVDSSTGPGQAAKPVFVSAEGLPVGARVR